MKTVSENQILAELFRHNLWANLTLIDFCIAQPDDILETNVPGTFGSIRDTLGHLAGVEEGYLSSLVGGRGDDPDLATLRERAIAAGSVLDLATVREHAQASGEGLLTYAETVAGNPTVSGTWFEQTYTMPAALFLTQAINHATEHRAQIKTALTQAGIEPPELDGWNWDRQRGEQPP